jgi:hypothetical protein
LDIEKPGIAYLVMLYLFSAIIFHVDSCENYATLDTPRGEKSGAIVTYLFNHFSQRADMPGRFFLPDISALWIATSIENEMFFTRDIRENKQALWIL